MKNNVIGLKELRAKASVYISEVEKGKSFIVVRRSKPVFKISPAEDAPELWERVVDFTKIKKDGISAKDILARL